MTKEEIAWLAGILEGEGCFGVYSTQVKKGVPRLHLAMTDKDIVERVADLLNTTVIETSRKEHKTIYRTDLARKKDLKEILIEIQPYMGNRRGEKISQMLKVLGG